MERGVVVKDLSFREVEHGSGSGSRINNQEAIVIVDSVVWKDVWNRIQGFSDAHGVLLFAEPPAVDFNKETIVVISRGRCFRKENGIEVKRVVEEDDTVHVQVQLTKSVLGRMAPIAITYPYRIIAIPSCGKPIAIVLGQ